PHEGTSRQDDVYVAGCCRITNTSRSAGRRTNRGSLLVSTEQTPGDGTDRCTGADFRGFTGGDSTALHRGAQRVQLGRHRVVLPTERHPVEGQDHPALATGML